MKYRDNAYGDGCLTVAEEMERKYDLDDRLIDFATRIIDLTEALPATAAGRHISNQLLRSGTSPAPNYAEAGASESRKDFIHKMGICLKELRESFVWLRIVKNKKMVPANIVEPVLSETQELECIFKSSIKTARKNGVAQRNT